MGLHGGLAWGARGGPARGARHVCGPGGPGQARPGQARPGRARPGQARPGQARPGQARPGLGPGLGPQNTRENYKILEKISPYKR